MTTITNEHKTPQYLHAFAQQVAASVGWTYDKTSSEWTSEGSGEFAGQTFTELRGWAYIVGAEGERVILHLDAYRGRISAKPECYAYIGGKRVEVVPYKFEVRERGCSVGSKPEVFARALKTHGVLLCALEAHKHAIKCISEHNESASAQTSALELLSRVPGVTIRKRDDTEASFYFDDGHGKVVHGSVSIDLRSLSADTARAVLKTLERTKGDQ